MPHPSRLVLLPALLLACAPEDSPHTPRELGSQTQEFRTGWWGEDHADITHAGLPFIREEVVDDIAAANEDMDSPLVCPAGNCGPTKLESRFHVDNCRVNDAFQSLRDRYHELVEMLDPAAPYYGDARVKFGSIVHTAQDFYAHSNWVDAEQTSLIAERGFWHPELRPGSMLGNMMLVAEPMPEGFAILRYPGWRVPYVLVDHDSFPGLITGTYAENHDASICPAAASVPHGDGLNPSEGGGFYMAKDDPDSPHHDDALRIAKRQTGEEFCRLVRLVHLHHGESGREGLLRAWVSDRKSYEETCPYDRGVVTAVFMAAI